MIKDIFKKRMIAFFPVLGGSLGIALVFLSAAFALDLNLWNLPQPEGSTVVWEDQRLQINGADAFGTHLRSPQKMDDVLNFYKGYFLNNGWELKDHFAGQNTMVFSKKEKLIYVVGQSNGEDAPCDVYVISSATDLDFAKTIAPSFDGGIILQRDVEGKDLPEVPRYPNSRRMMSMLMPNAGAMLVYQVPADPEEITGFYRGSLEAAGWQLARPLRPELLSAVYPQAKKIGFMFFEKGNENIFITTSVLPKEATGKEMTVVAVVKNLQEEFAYPPEEEE
jgi:hypothetical protein